MMSDSAADNNSSLLKGGAASFRPMGFELRLWRADMITSVVEVRKCAHTYPVM